MRGPCSPSLRLSMLAVLACVALACGRDATAPSATAPGAAPVETAPLPETMVTIGIHRIRAEIADTWDTRQRGLSGRTDLAAGHGMIFPYSRPSRPAFWMPDMHFDLDIIWIRDGRIVDMHVDVPHEVRPPLPRYSPRVPIDQVLEVPAGTVARSGWKIGDPVHADPEPRFLESEEG